MKFSFTIFLALAVVLTSGDCAMVTGQESDNQQELAEMKATIDQLRAEVESLRNAQNSPALDPLLVEPAAPVPDDVELDSNQLPPRRFPRWQQPHASPSRPNQTPYRSENRTDGYPRPDYPYPSQPYPNQTYPGQPDYLPPVVERVYVQQPAPVFVEPRCFHGDYGVFPQGGGFYAGPGGWGFGVGGLQFNFSGYGYHGHGHHKNKGHHKKHH